MVSGGDASAWLLMTVGDNRQHGGNAGYDDQPDVYYTWDSTVPNHASIRPGDPVAIWDKQRLLGVSVIEEIKTETKEKVLFKCPHCGKAGIKKRTRKTPRFKCYKCGGVFETPEIRTTQIVEYRSRHDAAWTSLEGLLQGSELRQLCASPKSQLSMRPLRWSAFSAAVSAEGADRAIDRVSQRAPDISFPQGHGFAAVRVRRGQGKFREHLLSTLGEECAFTGMAPARVLEAGHLYSYAQLGEHHEHGGLMLRRDVHRLFDDGWLAVDPTSLRIDVAESLGAFKQYRLLNGRPLGIRLRDSQLEWLSRHWIEHRAS